MKRSADGTLKKEAPKSRSDGVGVRWNDSRFDVPCLELATNLLGQTLVRRLDDGAELRCRIVETECYLGVEDKACHTYGGRRTNKNEPMYMKAGTSYVYFTYGMYHCFNISSKGDTIN